jgi:hypothetical protein
VAILPAYCYVVSHHQHQESRTIVSARKTEIKRPIGDALMLYQNRYATQMVVNNPIH